MIKKLKRIKQGKENIPREREWEGERRGLY